MSPEPRCPRCDGNLVADNLREAELQCLMCSRRWNLIEQRLEPAQLTFEDLPDVGDRRRARPRSAGFLQFHQ